MDINTKFLDLLESSDDMEGYLSTDLHGITKGKPRVLDFDQERDPEDYSTPEDEFARAHYDHHVSGSSPYMTHDDYVGHLRGVLAYHSTPVTGLTKATRSIKDTELVAAAKDAWDRRTDLRKRYKSDKKIASPAMQRFLARRGS